MSARALTVPSLYAALAMAAGLMLPRFENRVLPEFVVASSVPAAMARVSAEDRQGLGVPPRRSPA